MYAYVSKKLREFICHTLEQISLSTIVSVKQIRCFQWMSEAHSKCNKAGNVFHAGNLATGGDLSPELIYNTVTLLYKRKL